MPYLFFEKNYVLHSNCRRHLYKYKEGIHTYKVISSGSEITCMVLYGGSCHLKSKMLFLMGYPKIGYVPLIINAQYRRLRHPEELA